MKKRMWLIGSILITLLLAFRVIEKPLTVSGNVQEWQNVINCIDLSNAPHLQVKAAQEFLLKQLNDTTKQKK